MQERIGKLMQDKLNILSELPASAEETVVPT
jgi:hypothetical protein